MRIAATFISLVLLYSCNQQLPKDRAQALIKEKLSQIMDKKLEYEAVKFGSLDSAYSRLAEDNALHRLYEEVDDREKLHLLIAKAETNPWPLSLTFDTLKDRYKGVAPVWRTVDSLIANFKPSFKGWVMTHSYRIRGWDGHKELRTVEYYFDKNVHQITQMRQISIDHKEHDGFK
jgi:hypothetical protein